MLLLLLTTASPAAAQGLTFGGPQGALPARTQEFLPVVQGDPASDKVRLTWDDRPSLRFGKVLRLDFRAGLQGDFRQSQIDLSGAGGLFEVSRRRLGLEGEFLRHVEFQVEREFGATKTWRDVYVDVRRFEPLQVRLGRTKLPFSLDNLTSFANSDFVFRSLLARQLAPGRETGAMLHGRLLDRRVSYQAGVFRHDGDNAPLDDHVGFLLPDEAPPLSRGSAVAARAIVTPFGSSKDASPWEGSLHVGLSVTRSSLREGRNSLKGETLFGQTFFPRMLVSGPRFRVGGEAEWRPGPFSIRAELARTEDARQGQSVTDEDLPPIAADAWYVSGTWTILDGKNGKRADRRWFNAPFGRLDLVARAERLRLGSHDASEPESTSPRAANPLPDAETAWTFGVTWWLNHWTKVQVNVIRERLDNLERADVAQQSWQTVFSRLQFIL